MKQALRIICLSTLLACTSAVAGEQLFIENVNGYTLNAEGRLVRFQAMLIKDGKVSAIGNRAFLSALSVKQGKASAAGHPAPRADSMDTVRTVDGKGRTLLPGLIDAHGHVMGLGIKNIQADLVGTASLQEALQRVRSFASVHPDDAWVLGRGWNQVIWKLGRFPTAKELDGAVADRPVVLERIDGHAVWANSVAMKKAGISKNTPDPVGGRIERDAQGNPTGVFVDAASTLLWRKVPPLTPQQWNSALDAALAEMASVGMTGVADAGIDVQTFDLYKRYADQGRLTARIYGMISGTDADFDAISRKGPLLAYGNDFLTVRSVKLYADGALGSRGAALLAPYSDQPGNRGLLFHTPAELTAMIGKALSKGYQVNVHAIGDGGNREVLDAFEAAYKKHGGKALRNRVEHAQVLAPEDIPRFVPLNLIASMQPTHATSDMNMAEDRLGAERLKGAYAWQTFLKQGTHLAAGSDFPVEYSNPFFGLHAAVTLQDHNDKPSGGWRPQQAMHMTEAFKAFTVEAAYAAHNEGRQGSLEPGKWADFILIDRDIFTVAPEQIWKTQVLETWVGGKRVFVRKP